MNRHLYSLCIFVAQPLFVLYWWYRGLKIQAYWRHISERFGYVKAREVDIWVHAVSVGETQAAVPLIKALHQLNPQYRFLLTGATPTGRATAANLLRDIAITQCYLPIDTPFAVARFFKRTRPKLGIVMETEWWPNLLQQAPCPVALVNARLSEKSAKGYGKYPNLTAPTLQAFALIAAQDSASAERIQQLGAKGIHVTGNVKFDCTAHEDHRLAQHLPNHYLLAASTRDGEEQLLLSTFQQHELRSQHALVIVPRHPERFQLVFELAKSLGFRTARRSDTHIPADTEVIIGDSMGEMMAYYTQAQMVFMGGSYLPFGAHNFIEPCALGKMVLIGPSVFNFSDAAASALSQGAIVPVNDSAHAFDIAQHLINNQDTRNIHGKNWAKSNQGATGKSLALLKPLLPR